jgi:twitching motility two-component system response regulator PilH
MSIFDRLWGGGRKTAPQPPATTPAALSVEGPESSGTVERRHRPRKDARKGIKALIIDDSPTVIAALRKVLRSAGYNTSEALSAEQGLALIEQDPPDLVFLDIVLPGMNGFNALRLIRKNPASQHIPVIMISGNEHATEQFYANRIGADDFMKKPFSRFEIFARIENLLDAGMMPRRKSATDTASQTAPAPLAP